MLLPRMSTGDWIFWSIICWAFFNLFWLRFVEAYIPQWVGVILATVVSLCLFRYGPRPLEEEEEEEEE